MCAWEGLEREKGRNMFLLNNNLKIAQNSIKITSIDDTVQVQHGNHTALKKKKKDK